MISFIKKNLIFFDYKIKNFILNILQKLLFRNLEISRIHKIIIFRTGSIGDTICSFPSIYAIRKNFPASQIDILTNSGGNNLVSIDKLLDKTLINNFVNYQSWSTKDLFKYLKAQKYDLFIELPQVKSSFKTNIRNLFFTKSVGIKYAFGWEVANTMLFPKIQEKTIIFPDERTRLLNILEKNGIRTFGEVFPLNIVQSDTEFINNQLSLLNLDENQSNLIGMVIGAKRPSNRWPAEDFDYIIKEITNKGYIIVLIGGPEDTPIANSLTNLNLTCNLIGKLTPMQSAFMLSKCKLVITNDTGPMHLTYAVGTPLIALFSSRDYPYIWFPPKTQKNIVLRNNQIHCSVCFTESCINNVCMKGISCETVLSKFDELILIANKNEVEK